MARELGARGAPQIAAALEVLGGSPPCGATLSVLYAWQAPERRCANVPASRRGPHERRALARWLIPAHQALSEQAQGTTWAEGQAMPLETAIALALEDHAAGA